MIDATIRQQCRWNECIEWCWSCQKKAVHPPLTDVPLKCVGSAPSNFFRYRAWQIAFALTEMDVF